MFNAAIPGEGLTSEMGSRPWQNPPSIAKADEAVEYYTEKLTDPKMAGDVISIMEEEIPLTVITNSIILSAVMEGVHTIDVGMLVSPYLMELMELVAEQADIKYVTGLDEKEDNSILETLAATRGLKKAEEKLEEKEETVKPPEEIEEQPMRKGLMARGVM